MPSFWPWATCWVPGPAGVATSRSSATYKAVTGNPAAKTMIDAGRRKIANRVSPDPAMVTLTEVDDNTLVLRPEVPRA